MTILFNIILIKMYLNPRISYQLVNVVAAYVLLYVRLVPLFSPDDTPSKAAYTVKPEPDKCRCSPVCSTEVGC